MNQIREAREALGWSVERLAIAIGVKPFIVEAIEQYEIVNWDNYPERAIRDTFTIRGFKFDECGIVSPFSDESFKSLRLSSEEVLDLLKLAAANRGGITAFAGEKKWWHLRQENLVQFGAVRYEVIFDDETVHENSAEHRVRLSKRGRAWVEWHNK